MPLFFLGLLIAFLLVSAPLVATESVPSASLDRGYQFAYNLDFSSAQREFTAWQQQHPDNPMGPVSEAAGFLFSEFDRLGILQTTLFEKDSSFENRKKISPDPRVRSRFYAALQRADDLVRQRLSKNPNDQDALFAQTLSFGLRSDYLAMVEKRNMASLGFTKQASASAKKLLKIAPTFYDAYLATGVGNYIIGSMAAPVRWLLHFGGYQGDKKTGINELQLTAEHGRFLAPFARLLLAVAYLRENDKPKARALLSGLRDQFPANPLFSREITRLDSGNQSR